MRWRIGIGLLTIGLLGATMVLGANVYQAVVEVPNWSAALPDAVHAFRACVRHSHPGYFFQVLVPFTILSLVGATIAGWNRPRARNTWTLAALGALIMAEVFTIFYFFPRNSILFFDPIDASASDAIASAAVEWRNAHFLRMAILVVAVAAAARAFFIASATRTDPA